MSRYIGYLVLLISLCASGVVRADCEDPECPAFESIMLPVPTDCSKFIYCNNGVEIRESCQEGLHFNPILFICDWPASAGCVECVPTTEEPTTEEPTTEVPTTEEPTTEEPTTEEPTTEEPTTEEPTTEEPTTEEPTTEEPTTEEPTTEEPTTEEPTTEEPTTEEPTTEEPTTEEPTTEEPTTEEPTTEEPTTEEPEVCEIADCPVLGQNEFVFIRVPWSCSKYIMCLNEEIYEMYCAAGLIFDEIEQKCVIGTECDTCEIVETTTEPEITTEVPCEIEECLDTQETPLYLAVPWDCSQLILCMRGQTFEQNCGSGLHFSPEKQTCVFPENTVCEVCEQANVTTEQNKY